MPEFTIAAVEPAPAVTIDTIKAAFGKLQKTVVVPMALLEEAREAASAFPHIEVIGSAFLDDRVLVFPTRLT